jgi:peptidoglycan hydrolase-like protein with peptidoglycan-binding domain
MFALAGFVLAGHPGLAQAPSGSSIAQLDMAAVPALDDGAIRRVQGLLKQRGFDPGPLDGVVGPVTRGAVRAFQDHYGLKAGEIDNQTLFALGAADLASAAGARN